MALRSVRRSAIELINLRLVIEWETENFLSQAPPCFGRHIKPFAIVSINSRWVHVVGFPYV
jgi:hypothetical protein